MPGSDRRFPVLGRTTRIDPASRFVLGGVTVCLGACSGDLSTLDPAGPAAGAIAVLWSIMAAGSVLIFLATAAALALAWWRPRMVGGASAPRILVLWGGLVLPSAVLAALVVSAFALGERMMGARGPSAPLRIEVEARQWLWEFRYPAAGGLTTTDVLHIPAGRDVEFVVTSADVIHSFWVPRLGGKIDAIPGHANSIRLRADRPGRYGGVCAEFCGTGHGPMRFTVEAHPPEEYDRILARLAAEGGS